MNKQHTKLATLVEDIEIQNEYLKNELEEIYIDVFDNDNAYTDYTHHELIQEIRFKAKLLREYREKDDISDLLDVYVDVNREQKLEVIPRGGK